MKRNIFKIGLLTPYTGGNLGDAAIQEAMIQNIKVRIPQAKIYCFSLNPSEIKKRHDVRSYSIGGRVYFHEDMCENTTKMLCEGQSHGIRSFIKSTLLNSPLRKLFQRIFTILYYTREEGLFFINSYKILRDFEFLIVSGGGQLDEYWGGPWQHPYTLFKWSLVSMATRTKYMFVSVGAGSITSSATKFFIKFALKRAKYRSFRDQKTRKIVENLGVKSRNSVYPDLAYSLDVDVQGQGEKPEGRGNFIGIGILPYFHPKIWPQRDISIYEHYINELILFIEWLIKNNYRIMLFSSDIYQDIHVMHDLKRLLEERTIARDTDMITHPAINNVYDLLIQLWKVDLVIATRLHGVILSHLMNKPVLAVSYDPKVTTVMEEMDQMEYCMEISSINHRVMIEKFQKLSENKDKIKKELENKVYIYKDRLKIQYENILTY